MTKKTTNTKKSKPVGKAVKKTTKDPQWEMLAVELKNLIPQLDTEGLAFLVQQARVHHYNMQVDKLNKAALAADEASAHAALVSASGRKARAGQTAQKSGGGSFKIKGKPGGDSYYIYHGNNNAIFSPEEIGHLVSMVYAGGSDLEIRERLLRWFDIERRDFFSVAPIADKFDDRLKALVTVIKNSFKKPRK